jgi:hypothetical protein
MKGIGKPSMSLAGHKPSCQHSPTADILSGLSLYMQTDILDELTMNQIVTVHQRLLRILIIRIGGSGEQLLGHSLHIYGIIL